MNQIEIYRTTDGLTQVEVAFEEDTVWLSQKQMAELFGRDRVAITQHIGNIFKERELDKISVCKKFLHTGDDGKKYKTQYYNLDVVISVGYRVKCEQGTRFRQWATQRLKDYLVRGYVLNEKRLRQVLHNMQQLEKAVQLIQKSGTSVELSTSEAKGLLEIITNYTQSSILLNQYDNNILEGEPFNENITYEIEYEEAVSAVEELKKQLILKKQASGLFGNRKDESLKGLLVMSC
jgi:hypothetical protein